MAITQNLRLKLHRMLVNAPVIPNNSSLKHVGTAFQISRSTDFTDQSAMILEGAFYEEDGDNILLLENQIEVGATEVVYSRYAYIFGDKNAVNQDRDTYTVNQWSRISSSHGDQIGFKFDNTVLATPTVNVTEVVGSSTLSGYKFTVEGYKVLVGDKTDHTYTTWEISDTNNNVIYERVKDEDNLTSLILPKDKFDKNQIYFVRAKVISKGNGESNWGCFVFNTSIVANNKFELDFLQPFYYGQNLFMRLKLMTTDANRIRLVVKEVSGDFESATVYDQYQNISRSIKIPSSNFQLDKTYRLYACLEINTGAGVYLTALTLVKEFTVKINRIYPVRTDSRYSEQGTMLSYPGISIGQGVINTRELRDGTFFMGVNSTAVAGSGVNQNEFIIYAKYSDSIRTTNIRVQLPNGAPSIGANDLNFPYVNVLPLYDDRVVVNYCSYAPNSDYQKSVWCIYEVDWISKTYTCLGYKVFQDEGFSTALSSSAVVCRDNSIVYIPAEFYTPSTTVVKDFSDSGKIDLNNRRWVSRDGNYNIEWPTSFSNSMTITNSDDGHGLKFNVRNNTNANAAKIRLDNVSSTGFTVGFRMRLPFSGNNIQGDSYLPLVSFATSGNGKVLSMGINKSNTNTNRVLNFDFHQTLGDSGANNTPTTIPLTEDYFDVIFVVRTDSVKMFVNNTLVRTWTSNKALGEFYNFLIGASNGMGASSVFEIKDVFVISEPIEDSFALSGIENVLLSVVGSSLLKDLPLLRITYNEAGAFSNKFTRTTIRDVIKPTIKRNMTICPCNELPQGGEKFLIMGGSTTSEWHCTDAGTGADLPGRFYYKLENLVTWEYNHTHNGTGTVVENPTTKHLPATIQTQDNNVASIYCIASFQRADGKIVIFNNSGTTKVGGDATNTTTWLIDYDKVDATFCVSQNNDTTVDMPFRSTVALRDGGFLRIGNTLTTMPPMLGYMADPVNAATTTPIVTNKHLVVRAGERLAIENPYLYETITIEGTSEADTGILTWVDTLRVTTFTYTTRIITRDTVETQAEADAKKKEHLYVLDGVKYSIKN